MDMMEGVVHKIQYTLASTLFATRAAVLDTKRVFK